MLPGSPPGNKPSQNCQPELGTPWGKYWEGTLCRELVRIRSLWEVVFPWRGNC